MVTERLDMAIKNFQHMNQMVERYTRLCRSYVLLSEQFHQLDVEHMKLKGQVVMLLKAVKASKARMQSLEAEKATLQEALDQQTSQYRQELQHLTQDYEDRLQNMSRSLEEVQLLESLISGDAYRELAEAEEQMELVETTLKEMETDGSPDLSQEEKTLLLEYQANPAAFLAAIAPSSNGDFPTLLPDMGDPNPTMWHYALEEQPLA